MLCQESMLAQWVVQPFPTLDFLADVYFADISNGWVVGPGGVFRSTDGGDSWTKQWPNLPAKVSVAGISSTECWVASNPDSVLHTTDGGSHWVVTSVTPFLNLDSTHYLTKIFFLDSIHGWIAAYGWKN